jgi:hypothetical protein
MKGAALLVALLLWQAAAANEPPVAQPGTMQYERAIHVEAGTGQACAMLDAQIFPHAAPSLSDLRIFSMQEVSSGEAVREVPYAITLSKAATEETEAARVLNMGTKPLVTKDAQIVFDLEMPAHSYTDVTLNLDPAVHDFIATATVSGSDAPDGLGKATALGSYTLFDLASQRLSRDTTIPLQESTFKYLHMELHFSSAPGSAGERFVPAMVLGATVPPSREAQSLYTTVAKTAAVVTKGRETMATFAVPARIPVERVSFVPVPGFAGNFNRTVRVRALADASDDDGRAPLPEVVSGNIQRVHTSEAGHEIDSEQLAVDAILGANLQRAAKVEVAIENGDDQPLPIAAVRLEMRQRKICFEVPASGANLALFYGDSRLAAPMYDYARLFVASRTALVAELGPEALNPNYRAPAAPLRPFAERHPELLWIALIVVICALGMVALKAARNVGR